MIFRAIQELLNNAARHSQAPLVKLGVDMGESQIKVTVDDNGKGFDVDTLSERGGKGLKVIRDRAEMLGGYLEIDSAIGKGTRVVFQVPAASKSLQM
jgi:two-component system sensor histidine kinase DegS